MTRARTLFLLALLLAPASLAQPAEPWVLVVKPGERLELRGANATLTEPGRIEVYGQLVLEGDPTAAPARLSQVQLVFHGGGPHLVAHVRLEAPPGVAIQLGASELRLENVAIVGGDVAVRAESNASLIARDAAFDAQADAAVELGEAATASLTRVTMRGNGDGLRSSATGNLSVADSALRSTGRQLVVGLPDGASWNGQVTNTSFAPVPPARSAIGLAVHAPGGDARLDTALNRFRSAGVAFDVGGAGLRVASANDTFQGNDVAVRASGSAVEMRAPVFSGNGQDIVGDVTVVAAVGLALPATTPETTLGTPAPVSGPAAALPWFVAGLSLAGILAVGAITLRNPIRRWRSRGLAPGIRDQARARIAETLEGAIGMDADDVARAAGVAPQLAEALLDEMTREGSVQVRPGGTQPRYRLAPPRVPPDAAPADLATPLSPQEARILLDMADHPGTPQSAVAQRLGLSRQALHYHVKKLEGRGLLTKLAKGRETQCFVRPEAQPLVDAARTDMAVVPAGDPNRV